MSRPLLMFALNHVSMPAGIVMGVAVGLGALENQSAESVVNRKKVKKPAIETRVGFPRREKPALLPHRHGKD